ncbi:XRE family transcriptional regulator [Trebonia sp.]|uniref:XRE family transcriptional regulator n=1 Tax=Trebonia sp. TaxID=2767075 RepID=UPI002626E5E2|nr:XRE family transcriptional regulator [Trebonia sp.]
MPNERLRALLLERRVTPAKLAEAVRVDPKTVERWVVAGRIPYRKHRYDVATFLGVDESYIWPDALDRDQIAAASESEIVAVFPHRWAVPRDTWGHLFEHAEREIGILVYSGYFLAEDAGLRQLLTAKAEAGVRVRILLGDPESPVVVDRGHAEGIDDTMPAKVRSAIAMLRPLSMVENAEIRLHGTVLYNSIYRADEQLLVNTHIYGVMANNAPVFHLRKIPGGDMAATYLESFERVWAVAKPYEGNRA